MAHQDRCTIARGLAVVKSMVFHAGAPFAILHRYR